MNRINKTFFSLAIECKYVDCFVSDGMLTSANYPNDYDSNTADTWLITAPVGQTVSIHFVDFFLENNDCFSDYVILYDGDSRSDPRIGDTKYCDINSPRCQETSSNNLLVNFTSNSVNNCRGFSAKFYVGG